MKNEVVVMYNIYSFKKKVYDLDIYENFALTYVKVLESCMRIGSDDFWKPNEFVFLTRISPEWVRLIANDLR